MIQVSGVVERVDGSDAWVKLGPRAGGCGRCDEPGGCRSVALAHALKMPLDLFRIRNDLGVKAGELVSLRVEEHGPLRAAALGYGLGVLLLIGGAALGSFFAPQDGEDLYALFGAAAGILGSMGVNRWLIRRLGVLSRGVELARRGECAGAQRSSLE